MHFARVSFLLALLACATLLLWWVLAYGWVRGMRSMRALKPRASSDEEAVGVSVVVPARDEAGTVAEALDSLLAQGASVLQVIVVDDRSEDGTGDVARAVGARTADPRLEVLRVDALPAGWLGKTNAMRVGAERARGRWLLFTDADVVYQPGAIAAAVAYAEARGLDHLAVLPRFLSGSALLASFVGAFALLFSFRTRPWRARVAGSRSTAGIGAFALVRASAYRAIGGHERLRMRLDDDLGLGQAMKEAGFAQEAAFGPDLIAVEWYPDVASAVRGLQKNAFAGLGFSVWQVAGVVAALLLTNVMPFVVLPVAAVLALAGSGWATAWTWGLLGNAGVLLSIAIGYRFAAPRFGLRAGLWPLHPIAVTLLCYAAVRSALRALRSGTVEWRGTLYDLREVRRS